MAKAGTNIASIAEPLLVCAMNTKKGAAHTPVTDPILEDGRKGQIMVRVEIYEKGITYHAALTLDNLFDAEERELAKILKRAGYSFRVTPIEEPVEKKEGAEDDF